MSWLGVFFSISLSASTLAFYYVLLLFSPLTFASVVPHQYCNHDGKVVVPRLDSSDADCKAVHFVARTFQAPIQTSNRSG
jgi:hypothetical protein